MTSQREIIITHQPKNIYIYICIYTFIIASNYFHIFIYNPSHYISIIFHMFHMFISSLPKMVVPRNHLIFWCLIIKQPFQETSKYNQSIYIVIILSINTYNIIISNISIYISYHIISYHILVGGFNPSEKCLKPPTRFQYLSPFISNRQIHQPSAFGFYIYHIISNHIILYHIITIVSNLFHLISVPCLPDFA